MNSILKTAALRKTFVSALLGVALAAPAMAQCDDEPEAPNAASDIRAYYPLTVGNEWTFADDQGGKTLRMERKVIGVETVRGIRCAVMLSKKNGGRPFRNWVAWTAEGLTRFRTERNGEIVDIDPPEVLIRASSQNATWTNRNGQQLESCELRTGLRCERKDGVKSAIQVIRTRKFGDRTETQTTIYVQGEGPLVEIFQAGDRKLTVSRKRAKIVPPTRALNPIDDRDIDNGPRPNARIDAVVEAGRQALQQNNYQDAFRLFMTAAKAGHPQAQMHVGVCFVNGQGCQKNLLCAYVWYSLAAAGGVQQATHYRDEVANWIGHRAVQQAERMLRQVARKIQNTTRPRRPQPAGW